MRCVQLFAKNICNSVQKAANKNLSEEIEEPHNNFNRVAQLAYTAGTILQYLQRSLKLN
jgi:hypothetical protein